MQLLIGYEQGRPETARTQRFCRVSGRKIQGHSGLLSVYISDKLELLGFLPYILHSLLKRNEVYLENFLRLGPIEGEVS